MDIATHYDVTLDPSGPDGEKAGPLFQRYSVTLLGRVDRRWVDCYNRLTKERPALARFHLEPAASSVSFTCRATDGPAEVAGVAERLREMIGLVNQAAAAAAAEVEHAKMRAHGAGKQETAKPKLAAVAEGLLARLSRNSG